MTDISFMEESYLLCHRFTFRELTQTKFTERTLYHLGMGFFDTAYGKLDESYQPGKFMLWDEETGEQRVGFDDSKYKNAKCYKLTFAHKRLGNFPGLRALGDRDLHVQYIVSTNQIRPQDVIDELPSGDLVFNANLVRYPPHTITQEDGTQETLIEITPHLSPEEEGRLAKDANFFIKLKEKYVTANTKVEELDSKLFLKTTEAASAETVVVQQQHYVNTLLQLLRTTVDKLNKLGIQVEQRVQAELNLADGEHNLGFSLSPSARIVYEDITKSSALVQDNIHYIEAEIRRSGDLSQTKKWALLTQVAAVVGFDALRQFALGAEQRIETTPIGARNVVTLNNADIATGLMQYMPLLVKGDKQGFIDGIENWLALYDIKHKTEMPKQETPQLGTARAGEPLARATAAE